MPEGHTLYALARDLDRAFASRQVAATSPQGRFAAGAALLNGLVLRQATSRGKHLFAEFEHARWLHVHLGLIGTFVVDQGRWGAEAPVVGAVRLRLATSDHVADLRGPTVCEVVTPGEVDAVISRLGPDPLREGSDPELAWRRITRSSRPIGELLMDQSVVAGVGNVYRSDVLFRLRLDPFRPGRELRRASWEAIWSELTQLMPLGVQTGRIVTVPAQVAEVEAALAKGETVALAERTSLVYRRSDLPCPTCGARVRSRTVAGRTLYWCGRCQRRR